MWAVVPCSAGQVSADCLRVLLCAVAQAMFPSSPPFQVNWTEIPGSKIRVASMAHMALELAMIRLGYTGASTRLPIFAALPSCCLPDFAGCAQGKQAERRAHLLSGCSSASPCSLCSLMRCSRTSARDPPRDVCNLLPCFSAGGVWKVRTPQEVGKMH